LANAIRDWSPKTIASSVAVRAAERHTATLDDVVVDMTGTEPV
jgi:hypothetical protein